MKLAATTRRRTPLAMTVGAAVGPRAVGACWLMVIQAGSALLLVQRDCTTVGVARITVKALSRGTACVTYATAAGEALSPCGFDGAVVSHPSCNQCNAIAQVCAGGAAATGVLHLRPGGLDRDVRAALTAEAADVGPRRDRRAA